MSCGRERRSCGRERRSAEATCGREHRSAEATCGRERRSAEAASNMFTDAIDNAQAQDEVQAGVRPMPRLACGLPDLSVAGLQGYALAERQVIRAQSRMSAPLQRADIVV